MDIRLHGTYMAPAQRHQVCHPNTRLIFCATKVCSTVKCSNHPYMIYGLFRLFVNQGLLKPSMQQLRRRQTCLKKCVNLHGGLRQRSPTPARSRALRQVWHRDKEEFRAIAMVRSYRKLSGTKVPPVCNVCIAELCGRSLHKGQLS